MKTNKSPLKEIVGIALLILGLAIIACYGADYFVFHSSTTQADWFKQNWEPYLVSIAAIGVGGWLVKE